jgi:tRNA 2-thiouridine synthesizing protein C
MTTLLIISTSPPYYNSAAQDALEAALAASNVGVEVTFVLAQQGLYQLLNTQDSTYLHKKSIAKQINVMPLYDIDAIYYIEDDMTSLNLTSDTIIDTASAISSIEFSRLCDSSAAVIRF